MGDGENRKDAGGGLVSFRGVAEMEHVQNVGQGLGKINTTNSLLEEK